MKEPSVELLTQALKEMFRYYSRPKLGYRFTWFYHMLRRTDTISEKDKQTIEEVLNTMFAYEEIIQDDPIIQNLLAKEKLAGEARGEARARSRT